MKSVLGSEALLIEAGESTTQCIWAKSSKESKSREQLRQNSRRSSSPREIFGRRPAMTKLGIRGY